MRRMTRRTALMMLGAGGGLLGLGYLARGVLGPVLAGSNPNGFSTNATSRTMGPGMMGPGMMGGLSSADMRIYMEMFSRHGELKRTVEDIPGGIRTTTQSDAPDLVAQLQAHVSKMYSNLAQGDEVTCMSDSLPTLFRRALDYRREITFTANGVVVVETAGDPELTSAIRAHAREVSGFVDKGMPAMMEGMMGMTS